MQFKKGLSALDKQIRQQNEKREVVTLVSQLTGREKEVLAMVADGHTSSQIAGALELSPRTVESHRAAIGHKLGTTAVAEQVKLWIEVKEPT